MYVCMYGTECCWSYWAPDFVREYSEKLPLIISNEFSECQILTQSSDKQKISNKGRREEEGHGKARILAPKHSRTKHLDRYQNQKANTFANRWGEFACQNLIGCFYFAYLTDGIAFCVEPWPLWKLEDNKHVYLRSNYRSSLLCCFDMTLRGCRLAHWIVRHVDVSPPTYSSRGWVVRNQKG